jgi:hypothetical protein
MKVKFSLKTDRLFTVTLFADLKWWSFKTGAILKVLNLCKNKK